MKTFILAGGSGMRLWPLSRERYPKQFIKMMGAETSLFQETFKRSLTVSKIEDIYVIANERYKFLTLGEIAELGYDYDEKNILVEPSAKNTLPAICYGIKETCCNEGEIVAVFPSDHSVKNIGEFEINCLAGRKNNRNRHDRDDQPCQHNF